MNDNETNNLFAEMEQDNKEFLRRIEKASEVTIVGLVDNNGVSGAQFLSDDWTLGINLAGWKDASGDLSQEKLLLEMPVSKNDLHNFMEQIDDFSIVKLRAKLAEHPNGDMQGLISELISTNEADLELTQIASEIQQPVTFLDPNFGSFTLDRSTDSFCGTAKWGSIEIGLDLSCNNEQDAAKSLEVAKKLWEQESIWAPKVIDFAVGELLERKNDIWLDEDEDEVTPEEFKNRMILESVTVYPEGEFGFWHDDGDLFWGHSIQVSGNLTEGLTDVDTPG